MPIETTKQLYDFVLNRLEGSDERENRQIAEMILEYFLDVDRTAILINNPIEIPSDEMKYEIKKVTKRVNQKEPIQYILGEAKFYGFDFFVNPAVLIPRPETEELVDLIQSQFRQADKPKILDIGTGSGCIPITLAHLLPNAELSAIEISEEAVQVARDNIAENEVEVNLYQGDILTDDLPDEFLFDVIVSNPPYITNKEKELMDENVLSHEPHLALFVPDTDPLLFYNRISTVAEKHLNSEGKLFFEINEAYGEEVKNMLASKSFDEIKIIKDLQGKDRMISAVLK